MLPWQPFDVVRYMLLYMKANAYGTSFIVLLVGIYLIYQTFGLGLDVSS